MRISTLKLFTRKSAPLLKGAVPRARCFTTLKDIAERDARIEEIKADKLIREMHFYGFPAPKWYTHGSGVFNLKFDWERHLDKSKIDALAVMSQAGRELFIGLNNFYVNLKKLPLNRIEDDQWLDEIAIVKKTYNAAKQEANENWKKILEKEGEQQQSAADWKAYVEKYYPTIEEDLKAMWSKYQQDVDKWRAELQARTDRDLERASAAMAALDIAQGTSNSTGVGEKYTKIDRSKFNDDRDEPVPFLAPNLPKAKFHHYLPFDFIIADREMARVEYLCSLSLQIENLGSLIHDLKLKYHNSFSNINQNPDDVKLVINITEELIRIVEELESKADLFADLPNPNEEISFLKNKIYDNLFIDISFLTNKGLIPEAKARFPELFR